MDDRVSKPFTPGYGGTLQKRHVEREAAPKPGKLDIDTNCRIFNRPALLAKIVATEGIADKLAALFVSLMEETLPLLIKSITGQDAEGAYRALHSLKGASGNIGADRIYFLVTELDALVKQGDLDCLANCLVDLRREFEEFKRVVSVTDGWG
jgi:HPt (histidine-containing phosphotransfer) domain-containing protein